MQICHICTLQSSEQKGTIKKALDDYAKGTEKSLQNVKGLSEPDGLQTGQKTGRENYGAE
ncbi:MAG: hypothetical protein UFG06_13305 [Lachnospiraceae bacterium]|nr:hypothetical protein [Lachnospiraceae bacterium]